MIESIIKNHKIPYIAKIFHTFVLKNRPGRNQFSFFPSVKIDELYNFFLQQSTVQSMYILPYLLDNQHKFESIERFSWRDAENNIIEPL